LIPSAPSIELVSSMSAADRVEVLHSAAALALADIFFEAL
jgi:hypothetical protein